MFLWPRVFTLIRLALVAIPIHTNHQKGVFNGKYMAQA